MSSQSASPMNVPRPSPGAPPTTLAQPPPAHGLLLLGLSLGYFMVMLDTTVVTVALPTIGKDLSGSLSGLQWVSNGYTLTFAALLLTAGALSDRYGGRKVFLTGLWLFAIFSGASAVAGSMGALITLRALLGVAGALLLPTSLAIIAHAYTEPAARARAMGTWAAISGSALTGRPPGRRCPHRHTRMAGHLPAQRPGRPRERRHHDEARTGRAPRPSKGVDLPGQTTAVLALARA